MSRKRGKQAKVHIVFYGHCGKRSSFASQAKAEEAAQRYGREAGYTCEAFLCDKHLSATGRQISRWHVRAKTWLAPTGDPGRQFQSSTVSVEQLDRALGTNEEIAALLEGIPE